MDTLNDEELIEQLKRGETKALDVLYRRYYEVLYKYIKTFTYWINVDPEDIIQDVFERVIIKIHTFKHHHGSFPAWMSRIARNICIDLMRKNKTYNPPPPPPSLPGDEETMKAVYECLGELEDKLKSTVILRFIEDMTLEETGKKLGLVKNSIRYRVESALKKIRHCLELKGLK